MTANHSLHPLDQALALAGHTPGHYTGCTAPAYWNMVGPFGGVTAATMLQAALQHPEILGEPLALTVNYAGALALGPFTLRATPLRTNRSTQHWQIVMEQTDAQGHSVVTTTATLVTAKRRTTWSATDMPMPAVPPPVQCAELTGHGVDWLNRYEVRPIVGSPPCVWDGREADSLSQLWMRDAPQRVLDFAALAALADLFFPRIWLRRAQRVPIGTVSMTVYFHADGALLKEAGTDWLLGQARGQAFCNGFFDQTAQLWNASGTLLATSHQIVYYKE